MMYPKKGCFWHLNVDLWCWVFPQIVVKHGRGEETNGAKDGRKEDRKGVQCGSGEERRGAKDGIKEKR
jgi:hypothetical protein